MYSKIEQLLWALHHSDHCDRVYTKKKNYDPECDWSDQELTSVVFQGETFECPTHEFNDVIETIMMKFPETFIGHEEVDMVDFCKKYVSVMFERCVEINGNLRTKTEIELIRIVMCGKKPACGTMFSDKSLDELFGKTSVQKKVYSFVRDNMEKFL